MTADPQPVTPVRVSTGVSGLDEILLGGLPASRLHLVQGAPGTGKTTFALQFLIEGARLGETCLYVTLAESKAELFEIARSHGWTLDGVSIYELAPPAESFRPEQQYSVLHPSEVELTEIIWSVLEEVERSSPTRVVLDSMAELKLIANDPARYRRQVLGLKQFFAGRGCTVLLLDNEADGESSVQSIAHSVIQLQQLDPEHGGARRRLRVVKVRGVDYHPGYHDFQVTTGGVRLFPRLVAADHRVDGARDAVPSGIPHIDELLGGGLNRGTSTLLLGPAGTGKSVLLTQYAVSMAQRNQKSLVLLFDEGVTTFLARADGLGIPARAAVEQGLIEIRQLDAGEVSAGEFDALVLEAVENGAALVALDSLNGYLNAMAEERLVLLKLHELLAFLSAHSVVTVLSLAQHGLMGDRTQSPIDVSYLADTVVLLRYFEAGGELRKALSVVKKRIGTHERSIREFAVDGEGIHVGEPLRAFQGVLSGTPTFIGSVGALMQGASDEAEGR